MAAKDYVEIYHTDSQVEATRIADVVLRAQGVETVVHDRTDHAFPAPATQPGEFAVAVAMDDRERAVELLREYLEAAGATS
jgi:hypothetical protein